MLPGVLVVVFPGIPKGLESAAAVAAAACGTPERGLENAIVISNENNNKSKRNVSHSNDLSMDF